MGHEITRQLLAASFTVTRVATCSQLCHSGSLAPLLPAMRVSPDPSLVSAFRAALPLTSGCRLFLDPHLWLLPHQVSLLDTCLHLFGRLLPPLYNLSPQLYPPGSCSCPGPGWAPCVQPLRCSNSQPQPHHPHTDTAEHRCGSWLPSHSSSSLSLSADLVRHLGILKGGIRLFFFLNAFPTLRMGNNIKV